MNLQSLKIGSRLGLGFGLVLALCLAIGWVSYSSLAKQGAHLQAIGGNILPSIKMLGDMQHKLDLYRRWALRATYTATDDARAKAVSEMTSAREALLRENVAYKKEMLLKGTPEEPLYVTYEAALDQYFKLDEQQLLPLLANGARSRAEAEAVMTGDSFNTFNEASRTLGELIRYNVQISDAEVAAASATQSRAVSLLVAALAAALIIGAGASLLITRSITSPLRQAVSAANAIAAGDLSTRIEVRGRDEAAELMGSMKAMTDALESLVSAQAEMARQHAEGWIDHRIQAENFLGSYRQVAESMNGLVGAHIAVKFKVVEVIGAYARGDLTVKMDRLPGKKGEVTAAVDAVQQSLMTIIGQIKEATDSINTAAKEIAQGNTDLSQRTEEQASSLEETASSMEELTSTVKQNSENAKQANQLAIGASEVAVRGGAVVGEVVRTMDEITAASKKISDIISVIDGIAFQTNILALNAAVEAARAGEQGRGFAVVASEVRNLAQRSAAAAREIKTLIGDSVQKVESGSKLVGEAGSTIQEVVQQVKRVTDIMSEISAASVEQSSGIEQVNTAVTQMDEVTQQNAALVEQAAAAAESLQEQAELLADAVSVFKLEAGPAATPAAYDGVERRGPNRATNVARLKPAPAAPIEKPQPAADKSVERPPAARAARAVNADESWEEF
ncbi:MAG: methyl-accepting chemotaxis protein [bacterium]|jgi:methyl-accepting chemotaxis protein